MNQLTNNTQDQFANLFIKHLSTNAHESIEIDVASRLRFSREKAVQVKSQLHVDKARFFNPSIQQALGFGPTHPKLFLLNIIGSFIPLFILLIGLVIIPEFQGEYVASEIADVDAAILIDDLPPNAYTDQGFSQFIKTQNNEH